MKATLKVSASLGASNTKLKVNAQVWQVWDNPRPIRLAWENHHGGLTAEEKVVPILDEEYVEKSNAWHMYLAQVEKNERKMKWEKVSINLSTISE